MPGRHGRQPLAIEAADQVGHGITGAAPGDARRRGVRLAGGGGEHRLGPGDMGRWLGMGLVDPRQPMLLFGRERTQRINLTAGT